MRNKIFFFLIIFLSLTGLIFGQETYFGKNKVQYKGFSWQYIQTRHFDIYFYNHEYQMAKFASEVLESSYVVISEQLNYKIHRRIPIFIYNSPNDFQQTNIIPNLIDEGIGGFTEAFKNRIVIPHNGSREDFRHVLHHELTHAVIYDMLFGNTFSSLISRQRLFDLPLWFAEGYAEYSSRYGWDYFADMVVRDATINNYLQPLEYLDGYLAYKEGQALINYIVDNYGERKLGEILAKGKMHLTMNKALKASNNMSMEELWNGFSKEMKRRYWPEISKRKEPGEIAKALTNHEKDASNFNEKPIFSPKGDRLAIFSDRSDYTEIYLISAVDGKIITRLVKGERTGDLESLHSYLSGIAFSPDGEKIAFVAKSKGKDAIYFLTVEDKNIYKRKYFTFNSILSPAWSPDGSKLAFAAMVGNKKDIVIYDINGDSTYDLTKDDYDDTDPSWFPDSKRIAFSSDRPHPDNNFIIGNSEFKSADSVDYSTIYNQFGYGNYNIFTLNADDATINPFHAGYGQNREPAVSPDGKKICFVSNRNGIDNLYIGYADSLTIYAITDVLTGVGSPSWSPDGKQIAFSSFHKGGFDIFLLTDIKPSGNNGILAPTDFAMGRYKKEKISDSIFDFPDSIIANIDTTGGQGIIPDSAFAEDSTAAPSDSSQTASKVTDSTRIEDGDYVFVSQEEKTRIKDPLSDLFKGVHDSAGGGKNYITPEEQAVFDSISNINKLPDGEYRVQNYRVRFTPDYVNGGFSYDTFFGLRGQSAFVFSDYLGDHQIYLLTDLVNTIDQSNLQLYYFYNRMRVNFGFGLFHTKNYYIDSYDHLFSDRFYGFQAFLSRPFSKFSRVEVLGSQFLIDRTFHDDNDDRPNRSTKITTGTFSLVHDNILWGVTGPINGQRSRLDLTGAIDLFNSSNNISFYSAETDYRKYWHIKNLFSFAIRLSGGASWGDTPKRYFLGGTTNWIGNAVVDAEVYDVENLYFADVVTPLRGYEYYELSGTRYFVSNFEFRYPFIDYLKMNFPLPFSIRYVTGAIFLDFGSAWDENNFKGGSSLGGDHLQDIKSSFGFGIRANLGFLVLRYDLAWRTDYNSVAAHPKYYFSLGADF
jgi:Tol biopolymer transport system component